jgi:hypothetical protein
MWKRWKTAARILVLSALTLGLAACGGGGGGGDDGGGDGGASATWDQFNWDDQQWE